MNEREWKLIQHVAKKNNLKNIVMLQEECSSLTQNTFFKLFLNYRYFIDTNQKVISSTIWTFIQQNFVTYQSGKDDYIGF